MAFSIVNTRKWLFCCLLSCLLPGAAATTVAAAESASSTQGDGATQSSAGGQGTPSVQGAALVKESLSHDAVVMARPLSSLRVSTSEKEENVSESTKEKNKEQSLKAGDKEKSVDLSVDAASLSTSTSTTKPQLGLNAVPLLEEVESSPALLQPGSLISPLPSSPTTGSKLDAKISSAVLPSGKSDARLAAETALKDSNDSESSGGELEDSEPLLHPETPSEGGPESGPFGPAPGGGSWAPAFLEEGENPPPSAPSLAITEMKNEGGGYCTFVNLSWDSGQGVSQVELWRINPGGTSSQLTSTYGAGSYSDYYFPLTREEQTFTYELRAYDYDGVLIGSSTQTVTLIDEAPALDGAPSAQYNGFGQGCAQVKVTVGRLDDCDILRYKLQRREENGTYQTVDIYEVNGYSSPSTGDIVFENSVSPLPGDPGRKYWYQVIVEDQLGDGPPSAEIEVDVSDAPPAPATGLVIEADNRGSGCTTVKLTWQWLPDPTYDCDLREFRVMRREIIDGTPGTWEPRATVAGNSSGSYGGSSGGSGGPVEPQEYTYTDGAEPLPEEPDGGRHYEYRIDTVDQANQITEGPSQTVDLIDAPAAAPTDLVVTADNHGLNCTTVTLTWNWQPNPENNTDIKLFRIWRNQVLAGTPGEWDEIGTVGVSSYCNSGGSGSGGGSNGPTAYSYSDNAQPEPDEGVTYQYRVDSEDQAFQVTEGPTAEITLVDEKPEDAADPIVTVDNHGKDCSSANVSWTAVPQPEACDIVTYRILRSVDGGEFVQINQTGAGNTTYQDSDIDPTPEGRVYTYKIVSVDSAGQESEGVTVSTEALIDEAPGAFTLNAVDHQGGIYCASVTLQITNEWECDFERYDIYRSTPEGGEEFLQSISRDWNGTSYTDSNVHPLPEAGQSYTYRVVKVDHSGSETEMTATVTLVDEPPLPFAFFFRRDPNHSQVFLGWTPNFECDFDRVELYGGPSDTFAIGPDTLLYTEYSQGWTQADHSGLLPNTSYSYTLVVYDRAGQKATSTLGATTQPSNSGVKIKLFRNKRIQVPNAEHEYNPEAPEFSMQDVPDWGAEVTNETTPVGGKLWPVLEADIGTLERFSSGGGDYGTNRLRVVELPDQAHGVVHSPTNDDQGNPIPGADGLDPRHDLPFDNYNMQWYRPSGADWVPVNGSQESPNNLNQGGNTPYRLAFEWDSTKKPQGHNGLHRIFLKQPMRFGGEEYGDEFPLDLPEPKEFNVRNAVVKNISSSVGAERYIKFDPTSTNEDLLHPKIKFTIEDQGDPHRYKWYVSLRSTNKEDWDGSLGNQYIMISGERAGPCDVEFRVGLVGGGDVQSGQLPEWGTYAFTITITEIDNNNSEHEWLPYTHSSFVTIPRSWPVALLDENGVQRRGHFVTPYSVDFPDEQEGQAPPIEETNEGEEPPTEAIDESAWFASYFLNSDRPASDSKIEFLAPNLDLLNSIPGENANNTQHRNLALYPLSESDQEGTYIGLFKVWDAHKYLHRDHENWQMLVLNDRSQNVAKLWFSYPSSPSIWKMIDPYANSANLRCRIGLRDGVADHPITGSGTYAGDDTVRLVLSHAEPKTPFSAGIAGEFRIRVYSSNLQGVQQGAPVFETTEYSGTYTPFKYRDYGYMETSPYYLFVIDDTNGKRWKVLIYNRHIHGITQTMWALAHPGFAWAVDTAKTSTETWIEEIKNSFKQKFRNTGNTPSVSTADGRADALRHGLWNCMIMAQFSALMEVPMNDPGLESMAFEVTNSHEMHGLFKTQPDPANGSTMDLFNNDWSRPNIALPTWAALGGESYFRQNVGVDAGGEYYVQSSYLAKFKQPVINALKNGSLAILDEKLSPKGILRKSY